MPRIPITLIEMHEEVEGARSVIPEEEIDKLALNLNKVVMYSNALSAYVNYVNMISKGVDICRDVKRSKWKILTLSEALERAAETLKRLVESVESVDKWIENVLNKHKDSCKNCESYKKVVRASELWNEWKGKELCDGILKTTKESVAELTNEVMGCRQKLGDFGLLERLLNLFQRDAHQRKGNASKAT